MIFYTSNDEDKDLDLLITGSWDSTIKVYDCKDQNAETLLLRVMCGGHMDREITSLVFSEYLSLLASGSQNGIISIWDFDAGKLETALFGHEGEVTALEFIEGYPLLLSSSADGTICLWGTKPI